MDDRSKVMIQNHIIKSDRIYWTSFDKWILFSKVIVKYFLSYPANERTWESEMNRKSVVSWWWKVNRAKLPPIKTSRELKKVA